MERNEVLTAAAAPRRELPGSYVDWPAVLGGAVVAAAVATICTAFGAALGLSSISAEPGEGSFGLWLGVTGLWVVISLIAAFMAGGYIAGRMTRRVDDAAAEEIGARDGINGLVVWGLGTLLAAFMAASAAGTAITAIGSAAGGVAQAAGAVTGGVAQAAGGAIGGIAQGAGQAFGAANDDGDGVLGYINDTLMRPALDGATSPGAITPNQPATDNAELARQTGVILANVLRTGEIGDDERAFMIEAVAQRTGQDAATVEARVDQAVAAAQEARDTAEQAIADARAEAERLAQEAEDTAIAVAEAARKSAILTAFLLTAAALVAAAAAVFGGTLGGRHRDEGKIFAGFTYRF